MTKFFTYETNKHTSRLQSTRKVELKDYIYLLAINMNKINVFVLLSFNDITKHKFPQMCIVL